MRILSYILALFFISTQAQATVIGFEDINTRDNFTNLGIVNTYQGYEWGYGNGAGVAYRNFVDNFTGWATATLSNTVSGPPPTGISGTTHAWNWNGPQSLWIDFRSEVDFTSGRFANVGPQYTENALTLQLFGYDVNNNLIATSSLLNLTSDMQFLDAQFVGIHYLEIRADRDYSWFSMDDLIINENKAVSEASTLALLTIGLLGIGFTRRKKSIH